MEIRCLGLLLLGFVFACLFFWFFGLMPGNIVALLFYCLAYSHIFRDRVGFIPCICIGCLGNMTYGKLGKQKSFLWRQFLQGRFYSGAPL